jgi:hypothetical protein
MDKKIQAKLLEYILTIPQLPFATALSFLSGHLWIWVIYAYYFNGTRASKYLDNWAAKTALGAFWYAIALLPIYFCKYGFNSEVDGNIIKIIGFTLLVGSFLQAISTILIIKFKSTAQ